MRISIPPAALIAVLVAISPPPARAEETPLDPPIKVAVTTKNKTPVTGQMTGFDETGFSVKAAKGEAIRVEWSDLEARDVLALHRRAYGRKGTAEQWLSLARRLMGEEDPRWADQAFREALKLDPSLKDDIDAIKAAGPEEAPEASSEPAPSDKFWGRLTDEQSKAAVEELKQFARDAQEKIGHRGLDSFETDYFLFVTDLDAKEAKKWAGLLDKMYEHLLGVFAIPKGTNIWHGKAMVFVFKTPEDFVRYEAEVESYTVDLERVAGLCHQAGPVVRIAFYRQPVEKQFTHVLLHESVHGFLHRYRKARHIPSWINEGFAEWVVYDVLRTRLETYEVETMKEQLTESGGTGGMFDKDPIEPWQHEVAYSLTAFMIGQSKRGYVKFINAIKDGKDWREALEEDYGTTLEKLVAAFGQSLRLQKPLKP